MKKRKTTRKAKPLLAREAPLAKALGIDVARLLNEALRTERRVRHFLLESGEERVTEKNLVAILKELPDALEAPSVRTLVTSLREELSLGSDETLDPLEDVHDPLVCQAREKRRATVKKLLEAVGAAVGSVPDRKRPLYPLEALERIESEARAERKAKRRGRTRGTPGPMELARDEVARRYRFPSGDAFRQALYVARTARRKP